MRKFVVVTSSLLLLLQTSPSNGTQSSQDVASSSSQHVLEDGTPVKLRISQTVSSADAHVDDKVEFEVLEEVRVADADAGAERAADVVVSADVLRAAWTRITANNAKKISDAGGSR